MGQCLDGPSKAPLETVGHHLRCARLPVLEVAAKRCYTQNNHGSGSAIPKPPRSAAGGATTSGRCRRVHATVVAPCVRAPSVTTRAPPAPPAWPRRCRPASPGERRRTRSEAGARLAARSRPVVWCLKMGGHRNIDIYTSTLLRLAAVSLPNQEVRAQNPKGVLLRCFVTLSVQLFLSSDSLLAAGALWGVAWAPTKTRRSTRTVVWIGYIM